MLSLVLQREDYDLAAKIRDDLTRERGVDVHQIKRQLDTAIDSENYIVRSLDLPCCTHLPAGPHVTSPLNLTPHSTPSRTWNACRRLRDSVTS